MLLPRYEINIIQCPSLCTADSKIQLNEGEKDRLEEIHGNMMMFKLVSNTRNAPYMT